MEDCIYMRKLKGIGKCIKPSIAGMGFWFLIEEIIPLGLITSLRYLTGLLKCSLLTKIHMGKDIFPVNVTFVDLYLFINPFLKPLSILYGAVPLLHLTGGI
ncbi:hypothetical protein J2W48_002163 [Flavobacterium piscis]|uniref:Uncharacterized protein n=1 Tax=Flavobacterium piscis TaxID=1114874 RepID=A0ABU1Y7T5_9FLAO|nr:hypothetical protein [Flavobacterium piscis]